MKHQGAGVVLLVVTASLVAWSPAAVQSAEPEWRIPVILKERIGVPRSQEPVTFGIPFPEALGVRDPGGILVTDSEGRAVPAQFSVLSRWHGSPSDSAKPIKWLLVDFQGDAEARSGATYYVSSGRPAPDSPPLSVKGEGATVEVSSGRLVFRTSADSRHLFERVWLGGREISRADPQDASVLTLAPVTMVARKALPGTRDIRVSAVHGLVPGSQIAIRTIVAGVVISPGEGYGFDDRYPLQNRRGGKLIRMNPTPSRHQFVRGSPLIVGKGLPTEETVRVAGSEPDRNLVVLEAPLKFDHKPGEPLLLSTAEIRGITEVEPPHRLVLDSPLERDHFMGELVTAARDNAPPVAFRFNPAEVAIEDRGPLRTTIRLRGGFEANGSALMGGVIEYTARITSYAGKAYVKLSLTLENNGPYGYYADDAGGDGEIATWLLLRSFVLSLGTSLGSPVTVSSDELSEQFPGEEGLALYQGRRDSDKPERENFFYRLRRKGAEETRRGRLSGWIDLNDGSRGITLVVRDFWQNHPKSLAYEKGRLTVGLWPEGGHFPDFFPGKGSAEAFGYYAFEGGRHKTYEMYLHFYEGAAGRDGARQFSQAVLSPLTAVLPGTWYAESKALGMLAPRDVAVSDPELKQAVARYEKFQLGRVHLDHAEDPPVTIYTMRERISPARGYAESYYGWMNFGDLPYGETYSSLHYDWPYGMLLQFVRTGDPQLFDLGREMALHRIDIDHLHGSGGHGGSRRSRVQYLQRYEKDGHGYGERIPKTSHTWNGGMVLYYLMTGDRRAWEAALEVGEHLTRKWQWVVTAKTQGNFREIRHQGWSILNLLNLYRVSYDPRYLELATALFRNSLLFLEQAAGGKGYWGYDDQPQVQSLNEFGWVLDPLIQLHDETRDPELLRLLQRMAKWVREGPLVGGDTSGGKYRPLNLPGAWKIGTPSPGGLVVRCVFIADLFAYLYLVTGERRELVWARHAFRDVAFWFTYGNEYVPPGRRSPVSYTPSRFYQSETKIGAWLAKHPQTYLHVEWLLSRNAGNIR